MSRISLSLICIGLSCAQVLAAADAPLKPSSLSAAQIVEKHIAARGGLRAWHDVRSISWTGKMDAGSADSAARSAKYVRAAVAPNNRKELAEIAASDAQGIADKQVQLPFTLAMERPRKSRLELEFSGKTALQVYDGTNGWKVRPFLNRSDVEPFSAAEAKSEAEKSDMDGPLLDAAANGTKVDVEGMEPVEGHDAYRLKLTPKSGNVQHIWIDAQNFLDVKVEGTPRRMDGRMRNVWIYQRDFRSVQGLMMPFVLETSVEGYRDTHKAIIEKVTLNPKLDSAAFSKPRV